jgi:hypothetical protein
MVQFSPLIRLPQSALSTDSPSSGTVQLPGKGVVELVEVVLVVAVVVVDVAVAVEVSVEVGVVDVAVDVVVEVNVLVDVVLVVVVVMAEQMGGVPCSSASEPSQEYTTGSPW